MCMPPPMISEYRTRPSLIHVRPEALGRNRVGSPPVTGTVQVSHPSFRQVNATREPSGLNTGPYFGPAHR